MSAFAGSTGVAAAFRANSYGRRVRSGAMGWLVITHSSSGADCCAGVRDAGDMVEFTSFPGSGEHECGAGGDRYKPTVRATEILLVTAFLVNWIPDRTSLSS